MGSVVVVVACVLFLRSDPPESAIADKPSTGPSLSPPTSEAPLESPDLPSASPEATTTSPTAPVPEVLAGHTTGLGAPPGLQGHGGYSQLPKHRLTIRMSTEGQLGTVAWIIPTSVENHEGAVKVTSSTWTLTTTVYGNPDYAVVFGQQGRADQPVTCEIRVDGKVTDRRSTKGAYSAMWCQG